MAQYPKSVQVKFIITDEQRRQLDAAWIAEMSTTAPDPQTIQQSMLDIAAGRVTPIQDVINEFRAKGNFEAMKDDVQVLRGLIDKYLTEGEYEIVSELAEVTEKIKFWQENKEWEAHQAAAASVAMKVM
jgi:hypothetical protein